MSATIFHGLACSGCGMVYQSMDQFPGETEWSCVCGVYNDYPNRPGHIHTGFECGAL